MENKSKTTREFKSSPYSLPPLTLSDTANDDDKDLVMNTSTMQSTTPPMMNSVPQPSRQRQQSDLMLAVALAGLGTYAAYTTLGDMQTVIYTVGSAYVLRILMQNPEIMRQLQARLSSLQNGRPLITSSAAPIHFQGQQPNHHGSALPRIDTSYNHPAGNGYQPLQATNGGSGLYDDFENSMATPTTPDLRYAPLPGTAAPAPAASRMPSRPDSRTSTVQQRGPSPSITVATATPTVRAPPSIGMNTRPGADVFDPRASTVSTFSAFAIPMTNPFASYQHYDNGTVNGERLLSPIHENDATEQFAASQSHSSSFRFITDLTLSGGPFDTRASLVPGSGFDPRASIVSTFSAFAIPTVNPFSSYTFYDAGTIGGERVAQGQQPNETLSERIAAPPHRSDTSATVTQANVTPAAPAKTVSQSPYDAGAVIGQQLARRASRCYTGVSGVGLPGAGTLAAVTASTPTSPATAATPSSAVSMSEYVPKRKHRQPTVAARVGEVAAPGGGIAPAPEPVAAPFERSSTPVIQAPVRSIPRPPTPGATNKRAASPRDAPVPLPTTTRVELPARKSTVTPLNRTPSTTSPLNLNRNGTASPLKRSTSNSPLNRASPNANSTSPAPPVPRLNSPTPDHPPVRFFDSPLVNSPSGGNSIHPISPPFVASATAPFKASNRSASGYESDSSHASSSTSSRRSQERVVHNNNNNDNGLGAMSHTRTDSLGLPSYEKHVSPLTVSIRLDNRTQ